MNASSKIEKLDIKVKDENKEKWILEVKVGKNNFTIHEVMLTKNYYNKLGIGGIAPEDLIRKSFEFLLSRESKESILKSFDLKVINNYFPEYEAEIKEMIN